MKSNNSSLDQHPVQICEPPLAADVTPELSAVAAATVLASTPSSNPALPPDPQSSSPSHLYSVCLLAVDTIEVGPSPNRTEASFESEEFFQLNESILHNRGNQQPIAVRQLLPEEIPQNSSLQYRLISGERRLRACAMHQLPVLAMICEVAPTRELVDRLIENHLREPLSPYELGLQLRHIIDSSESISRRSLARLLGLAPSAVQKAVDIANLPQPVIEAFSNPSAIQYRDSKLLKDAVAASQDAVVACAKTLKGLEFPSKDIIKQLVAAAGPEGGVEPFNTSSESTQIEVDGQAIGTLITNKKGRTEIQLTLPLNARQQAELAQHLEKFIRSKILKLPRPKTVRKDSDSASTVSTFTAAPDQSAANDSSTDDREAA